MALLQRQQLELRNAGSTVTIPNDPTAKLMYYFDCVCHCVDTGKTFAMQRLRGYQYYTTITESEKQTLLILCLALSPDKLIGKVFFESDKIDGRNKFLEISAVSTKLVVTQTLLIGGQQKRVQKIMMFKREWIQIFYIQPIREVVERRPQALPAPAPPPQQNRPPQVVIIRQNRPQNTAPPSVPQTQSTSPPESKPASQNTASSNQRRPVVINCCTIL